MIQSITHKAFRQYYESGSTAKLPPEHLAKIALLLTVLDAVADEHDIVKLGFGVHKLGGNLKDFWAIKVSANYRLIFRFDAGDVWDVDYLDYH